MENKTIIRPMASLLGSLHSFAENAQYELFTTLFEKAGKELWNEFKRNPDVIKLWIKMDYSCRIKFATYLESITPVYNVEYNLCEEDIMNLFELDNNLLAPTIRNLNVEKYLGNMDENAVIKYIIKNR